MYNNEIIFDILTGKIPRTPIRWYYSKQLLSRYPVTGGHIDVQRKIAYSPPRLVGAVVNGRAPALQCDLFTKGSCQPYAKNLACLLFELRVVGVRKVSRFLIGRTAMQFLLAYTTHLGLGYPADGYIVITGSLIEGLGKCN